MDLAVRSRADTLQVAKLSSAASANSLQLARHSHLTYSNHASPSYCWATTTTPGHEHVFALFKGLLLYLASGRSSPFHTSSRPHFCLRFQVFLSPDSLARDLAFLSACGKFAWEGYIQTTGEHWTQVYTHIYACNCWLVGLDEGPLFKWTLSLHMRIQACEIFWPLVNSKLPLRLASENWQLTLYCETTSQQIQVSSAL